MPPANRTSWRLTVSNSPGRAGWPDPSRVFEKYYRNPAANYRSGTGLGLFLIQSLAERLGFRVEYQPNEHSIVFHLVIPATTSPGNVLLLDNATSITVFAGGASSVASLIPFFIPLGIKSVSGAWKITTGANVSAIGIGNFT